VGTTPLTAYVADPKLCVYVFAQDLGAPRGMAFASNGDLFVSNNGKLTVLWDANADGASASNERMVFGNASGLNHGVVFSRDEAFIYASSQSSVYRWPYTKGQHTASGAATLVIDGIDGGGHSSRPLAFDSQGRLYVSVGSAGNVDQAAKDLELRSQIRRFTLPASLPAGGIPYTQGEVIATGMRNESGIFIDAQDRLWGVENGRDNLSDDQLGGDIHNDNPGEELNLVDGQGAKHYGYPHCFSEHIVSGGKGSGAQWADETIDMGLRKTDAYCQDAKNVHPPAYVMPAHWAPLGVIQYTGRALPYTGDLLVGAHGSWNRDPASGRVIARAHLSNNTVTDLTVLVGEKSASGELKEGTWNVRPVEVRQGPDEALYVSDDQGGRVLKIGYRR
jgi:glucose/arabinose dehydrogenase